MLHTPLPAARAATLAVTLDAPVSCKLCGTAFPSDKTYILANRSGFVCKDCFAASDYITCARCSEKMPSDDDSHYLMENRESWCQTCYDLYGACCEACAEYFPVDSVRYDNDDVAYCDSCADDNGSWGDDDDDDVTYDGETIHQHDADVFWVLSHPRPAPGLLHFGFELELNTNGDYDERYDAARTFIERSENRGIVKCDGSIGNGTSGIELVSVPMPANDLCALVKTVLADNHLHPAAFADSSCGLHVHASRGPLALSTLAKLVRFIHGPQNLPFIEYVAGRHLAQHRFAAIDSRTDSWKACNRFERFGDGHRYAAVNFCNTDTIEFRMFRGSTNASRVCAAIEFCAALLAFCAPATTPLTASADAKAFMGYVQRHQRSYPDLHSLLYDSSLTASPSLV